MADFPRMRKDLRWNNRSNFTTHLNIMCREMCSFENITCCVNYKKAISDGPFQRKLMIPAIISLLHSFPTFLSFTIFKKHWQISLVKNRLTSPIAFFRLLMELEKKWEANPALYKRANL